MAALYLGEFLVTLGEVTSAEVDRALARQGQSRLRFGDRAMRAGLMTEEQVNQVRACQDTDERLFGEIAITLGFINRGDVVMLQEAQDSDHVLLGDALVHDGVLSELQLAALLRSYADYRSQVERNVASQLAQARHPAVLNALIQSARLMFPRHGVIGCRVVDVHMAPHATQGIDWTAFQGLQGDVRIAAGLGIGERALRSITRTAGRRRNHGAGPGATLSSFLRLICEGALGRLGGTSFRLEGSEVAAGDGFRQLVEFIALREYTQVTLKLALSDGAPAPAILSKATIR